jgi:ribosomal protein L20
MPISDEDRKAQRDKLRKRSTSGFEQSIADKNRAAIEAETAAMAPPTIKVKQCHVCMSERRLWIEQMLLKGISYSAISNNLKQAGEDIDRRSISRHSKEHMAINDAVTRAVMEQEADLLSQQYEEGVAGAFTTRGALNVLIRKAFDDAMAGVTTVEPRDMIQMIRVYNEMESSSSVVAVENAKQAVTLFMTAIKTVVNDLLEPDVAYEVLTGIQDEVKRLRQLDEVDVAIEKNLKALPDASPAV